MTLKKTLFALLIASGLSSVAYAQPSAVEGYQPIELEAGPEILTFEIAQGDSLHTTLNRWAKQAGWSEVQWELPPETDFLSGKTVKLQGEFMKVVTAVVTALRAEAELQVEFDPTSKRFVLKALN